MSINKITTDIMKPYLHSGQQDVPGKSASEMKEFFDGMATKVVIPKINEIIDSNTELSESVSQKADSEDTYTKTESDELLKKKADADAVYSKEETDLLLSKKADTAYVDEQIEKIFNAEDTTLSEQLAGKADADSVYTKEETDDLLSGKADAAELKKHISETDGISAELEELKRLTGLPDVTTEDDGKMLRVVDGVWTAVKIASAEEGSF